MAGRIDADIGADKTVVADGDAGFVEDGEIEVGKEALANAYLRTVVASKGLVDEKLIVTNMSEQCFQYLLHTLGVRGWESVVLMKHLSGRH